jgi:hypothetical protein
MITSNSEVPSVLSGPVKIKDYKIGFCFLDNNHSTNFIWKKKLLNSDEEPIINGCSVDLRGMLM